MRPGLKRERSGERLTALQTFVSYLSFSPAFAALLSRRPRGGRLSAVRVAIPVAVVTAHEALVFTELLCGRIVRVIYLALVFAGEVVGSAV
jgi:hypothetical protein